MFTDALEEMAGVPDAAVDASIRELELQLRVTQAELAAALTVAEGRGSYRDDGHRSMAAYLRATFNASDAEASRQRRIARVCAAIPALGDALATGHIGVSQVLEFNRVWSNPRVRDQFVAVAGIYLDRAEHLSAADLKSELDGFVSLIDQDGAFDDTEASIEGRDGHVTEVGAGVKIDVSGGDPVTAHELWVIFEEFVQREFDADVAARRDEHGELADQCSLPRTAKQRRFDAIVAIFRAAHEHGAAGGALAQVVNIIVDHDTVHAALTAAGITLPGGETIHLDDLEADTLDDVIEAAAADPHDFVDRRCETANGTPVHPLLVLRAALTGMVRRVVVDSRGVVVDYGRTQRLFPPHAKAAAKLLARRCDHPGCTVPARHAEVDHMDEWYRDGGRTDQANAAIECTGHNRFKHRKRWKTRRDERGRVFSIRPDGTIVLPVGAREPDLSDDEARRAVRRRLDDLIAERGRAG